MMMLFHDEQQQQIEEERNILHSGTVTQRRRLLRMRKLPLPADLEAVAVLGTAVIDLPPDDSSRGLEEDHADGADSGRCNNVQRLADRCKSSAEEVDTHDGVDYSTFMDVLCPNGTSLLENLPISSLSASQPYVKSDGESPGMEAPAPVVSPVLPHPAGTRPPSPVVSCDSPAVTSAETCLTTPKERSLPAEHAERTDTSEVRRADAPISFRGSFDSSKDAIHISSPIEVATAPNGDYVTESTPQVFVSCGSLFITPPRITHRRDRWSKHASAQVTPASRHNSLRHSLTSAEHLSSYGRSCGTSPADDSLQGLTPVSDPHIPLNLHDTAELAGRVLLTDRLVKAQSNTALPTMMEAFRQYVQAASTNTSTFPSPLSPCRCSQKRHEKMSEKEAFAAAQQVLAPRQRGIVLKSNNTDKEVLKCVTQAQRCARPSFRYIDAAELYGASAYHTSIFVKKK